MSVSLSSVSEKSVQAEGPFLQPSIIKQNNRRQTINAFLIIPFIGPIVYLIVRNKSHLNVGFFLLGVSLFFYTSITQLFCELPIIFPFFLEKSVLIFSQLHNVALVFIYFVCFFSAYFYQEKMESHFLLRYLFTRNAFTNIFLQR